MRRQTETPRVAIDSRSARTILDQTRPKSQQSQSLLTRWLSTRCLPYSSLEEGEVGFPVAVWQMRNSADWRVMREASFLAGRIAIVGVLREQAFPPAATEPGFPAVSVWRHFCTARALLYVDIAQNTNKFFNFKL